MIGISIIMPLYNAEKFLKESLDSIMNQSFTKFELICINDASTDATSDILNIYKKNDERIIVLNNSERKGAAYARNRGIESARGECMIFLDGDDVFDEEMLKLAYDTIEKYQADVVKFGYAHVPSEEIHNRKKVALSTEYINRYCKQTFAISELQPYEWVSWNSAPWNKLFRTKLIKENNIKFQSLSSSNDVYFVDMAFLVTEKIIELNDERVMVYARDHKEPSRISNYRDPMCVYKAIEYMQKKLLESSFFSKCYQHFYYKAFFMLKDTVERIRDYKNAEEFYAFLKNEGIANLRMADKVYYTKLDSYIRKCIEGFEQEYFETRWFTKKNQMFFFLKDKKVEIIKLFNTYILNEKKIAIWGTGKNGYSLLEFCEENNLKLSAVIDRDKGKQGNSFFSYTIQSYEEVREDIQVIIVSALNAYEDVINIVNRSEIEVVDMNAFLGIS